MLVCSEMLMSFSSHKGLLFFSPGLERWGFLRYFSPLNHHWHCFASQLGSALRAKPYGNKTNEKLRITAPTFDSPKKSAYFCLLFRVLGKMFCCLLSRVFGCNQLKRTTILGLCCHHGYITAIHMLF